MTNAFQIAAVRIEDEPDALTLLSGCGLETRDIQPDITRFLAAKAGETILGIIGLEKHGRLGVVRSMAVAPPARRCGIAAALYRAVEHTARDLNLSELYALTETAETFFQRARFVRIDRQEAPAALAATEQFASLCPASAAVMRLDLSPGELRT